MLKAEAEAIVARPREMTVLANIVTLFKEIDY